MNLPLVRVLLINLYGYIRTDDVTKAATCTRSAILETCYSNASVVHLLGQPDALFGADPYA
jgi:hypothetical protein